MDRYRLILSGGTTIDDVDQTTHDTIVAALDHKDTRWERVYVQPDRWVIPAHLAAIERLPR